MAKQNNRLIVAGIDGGDLTDSVIDHAIFLSKTSGDKLKFLHTIEHSYHQDTPHHEGMITPTTQQDLLTELSDEQRLENKQKISDGKALLNDARQKAQSQGIDDIVAKQRHGSLAEALVDLEQELSMVVIGAKGEDHQGEKQGLGSQLEGAIRAIHSPVFIVKTAFSAPQKMMFAYNGSPTSKTALEVIVSDHFFKHTVDIHLVTVKSDVNEAQEIIDEALVLFKQANIKVTSQALQGESIEALTAYQQDNDIDLTAMGAFGHGKIHGLFFGSFTTRMLLESNTNFLLIR